MVDCSQPLYFSTHVKEKASKASEKHGRVNMSTLNMLQSQIVQIKCKFGSCSRTSCVSVISKDDLMRGTNLVVLAIS